MLRYGAVIFIAGLALTSPASAEWRRIGPGPSLDYALAYCDNQSMMVGGYRPQRLGNVGPSIGMGMADLGGAIGARIRESRFKNNCMVMLGWKNGANKSKKKWQSSK